LRIQLFSFGVPEIVIKEENEKNVRSKLELQKQIIKRKTQEVKLLRIQKKILVLPF